MQVLCKVSKMKFLSDFKAICLPTELTSGFGAEMTLSRNWVPLISVKIYWKCTNPNKKADVASELARYEFKIRWLSPNITIIFVWVGIRMFFTLAMYSPQLWRHLHYVSPTVWFDNTSMSETERLILPLRFCCISVISWVEWTSLLLFLPNFVKILNNQQIYLKQKLRTGILIELALVLRVTSCLSC